MAPQGSEERGTWSFRPSQLLWKLSDAGRQMRERKLLSPTAALGRRGEDAAHRYLRSLGYTVVARNYRPGPDSEIDIIARHGATLVFVEVKSRQSAEFGSPERAIGSEKQDHIVRAARAYVTRSGASWSQVRFDIISVVFSQPVSITHYKDVFFAGRPFDANTPSKS